MALLSGRSPFSSRTRTKVATMSCGSLSINVWDEVLIDVRWKILVDRRVASVGGGERVSEDEIGVWVDVGLHSQLANELKSQPCLAAQYRSMFGMKYRSMSDGILVNGRLASAGGGERVSDDEIGVWVDVGWRVSIDKIVLSMDEERLSLWIERSKLAGSDEISSGVSLLLLSSIAYEQTDRRSLSRLKNRQGQTCNLVKSWALSRLEPKGLLRAALSIDVTRDDHRARPSVDIEERISIDVHIRTSIDSEARRKPVWSQPT
ncbi:hypothetical protein F2Q68_00040133 [Brassica cretica]|uniref:Uncharacterized protein n=1 Tax=Brassica cretica TaxID=69181 RepID=A0A8S9MCY2_BRACR|nr:hypothetical protein F2Q68_00040133 [Brassica cretica]